MMMRIRFSRSLLLWITILPVTGLAQGRIPFAPPGEGFSVLLPAKPRSTEQRSATGQRFKSYYALDEKDNRVFLAQAPQLAASRMRAASVDAILNESRDGALEKSGS